jgi:hypothetical protein
MKTREQPLSPAATDRIVTGPWLDSEAARKYLGLPTAKALREAVRRGNVPVHRLGRLLRFSQSELDGLFAED